MDEFITTKKNIKHTINDELKNTFSDVDCVQIPWVMMSCSGLEKNPQSVLLENVYRWNHDERHYHKVHKFRCRFNRIEVKCIFKCDKFEKLWDHHPKQPVGNIIVVDGISKKRRHLTPFYNNLRETNIANGYLLCCLLYTSPSPRDS